MRSRLRSRLLAPLAVVAVATALTACAGASGGGAQPTSDGKLTIATSTNVWASVASAVGGDKVSVRPVIADPAGDPHSYESSAQDVVTVQSAQLALYNGGGYDDFFTKLADQAQGTRKLVAFDISGKGAGHETEASEASGDHAGHSHGEVNEHVWYDLPTVQKVADQVAVQLGELKPEARQVFTDNANVFRGKIGDLMGRVDRIGATPGKQVLATEPVAHYLLDEAKVADVTPKAFTDAVENESDVPPAALDEVQQLIGAKQARAVINNAQTTTPATTQVVNSARGAGIPIVDVTETLPAGVTDYVAWMGAQVDALAVALP